MHLRQTYFFKRIFFMTQTEITPIQYFVFCLKLVLNVMKKNRKIWLLLNIYNASQLQTHKKHIQLVSLYNTIKKPRKTTLKTRDKSFWSSDVILGGQLEVEDYSFKASLERGLIERETVEMMMINKSFFFHLLLIRTWQEGQSPTVVMKTVCCDWGDGFWLIGTIGIAWGWFSWSFAFGDGTVLEIFGNGFSPLKTIEYDGGGSEYWLSILTKFKQ